MRCLLACTLVLVVGGRLSAADEPTSGPAEPLSAAKRDFDAIKAARDQPTQPLTAPPQRASAETGYSGLPAGRPATRPSLAEEAQRKQKSNWLLEAMARHEAADEKSEGRTQAPENLEQFILRQRQAQSAGVAATTPPSTSSLPADAPPKKIEGALNPLTQFLNDWMTPQDYALLKPALEPAGTPAAAMANADTDLRAPSSLDTTGASAGESPGLFLGGNRGGFAPIKPAENPYLQVLNEPAPFVGLTAPLPPVASAPPAVTTPVFAPGMVAPTPLSAPKIPDFVRPIGDDRYFKPLKRF